MYEFYLLDIDYVVENEKPVIRLFGKIGKKNAVVLYGKFLPYLYVLAGKPGTVKKEIERIGAKKVEIVRRKVLGKEREVLKVVFNNPKKIPEHREELKKIEGVEDIREFDIPFTRRFLIDKELVPFSKLIVDGEETKSDLDVDICIKAEKIELGRGFLSLNDLRVLSFDIEVYNPEGVPRPDRDQIIMASFADLKGWSRVFSLKPADLDYVEVVNNEAELIEKIVKTINEADVLVTYNGDQFDFGYLRERAKRNKVKLETGWSRQLKFVRRGRTECARMEGIVHVDLYHTTFNFIRRTVSLPKYTLENLAEKFLDWKKEPFGINVWRAWDSGDIRKLAKYSKEDAEATVLLAKKFLPIQVEFSNLTREVLFNVTRMTSGQLVETLLLNNAHKRGEVAPNRPKYEEKMDRAAMGAYKGAYVKEPKKGLHENLALFDFRSLYPTIIVSFNIDPTMRNCKCCNTEFCQKRKGMIPEILGEIIKRRTGIKMGTIKSSNPEAEQYALKLLANSFYGFYGYMGARWYSRECAESITALGRKYIQETIKEAEENGFEVIYGDTDSLFATAQDVKKRAKEFLKKINDKLPGIMELELEGFYRRGIFVTKKRYALIDEKGRITTKGLEVVRRDWAEIAKNTQQRVLHTVLEGKPEKAAEIVKEVIRNLKNKKIPLDDLIIYTQMIKAPEEYKQEAPHVVVAKKIAERGGRKVERGTLIGYIVCKGSGKISDRSKPPEEVEEGEYDAKYYIENQVLPPVIRILNVLGYTEEDLIGGQRKLMDF